jgi:hypothetical protein
MNEADVKVKQQIVEKIKTSTNILVTVSKNPSVDELSAAIGLATVLNKIGKHTTAIFSGEMPPAITFLNPDGVFENTVDSLRDFIIALDKEKADHLRYKVDGDVVKIFITPYRTVITGDDLEFSQGDYNVELVLALGVNKQENLDTALAAHGRILHDVSVATLSAGEQSSQLGNMDWRDADASGLSEMVASITESLKEKDSILDKQIATALLTGIVAATERFSNNHTSSRAMTIAAQLMAAGADQQLIAAKLQESHTIQSLPDVPTEIVVESESLPIVDDAPVSTLPEPLIDSSTLPPGNLVINHESDDMLGTLSQAGIHAINNDIPDIHFPSLPAADSTVDYSESTLGEVVEMPNNTLQPAISTMPPETAVEPELGGTLNATTDRAAEDARRELEDQQNKTILSHSYLGDAEKAMDTNPINGINQTEEPNVADIFAGSTLPTTDSIVDLPLPPQLPDFSTLPPPPIPDFSARAGELVINPLPSTSSSQPTDPGQFRIPGQ